MRRPPPAVGVGGQGVMMTSREKDRSWTLTNTTATNMMDDADVAAGEVSAVVAAEQEAVTNHEKAGAVAYYNHNDHLSSAPSSSGTAQSLYSTTQHPSVNSDLEFFEGDLHLQPLQHNQYHHHEPPQPPPLHRLHTSHETEGGGEAVLVLGFDISHLSRRMQFVVCASGVFWFSLLYGYLQELLAVQLCNRQLGLFLASAQFTGYTVLAYGLRELVHAKTEQKRNAASAAAAATIAMAAASSSSSFSSSSFVAIPPLLPIPPIISRSSSGTTTATTTSSSSIMNSPRKSKSNIIASPMRSHSSRSIHANDVDNPHYHHPHGGNHNKGNGSSSSSRRHHRQVPMLMYLGLSLLRALDLGMTNLAMQYINYPAKTLIKSSRVVFTMLFGVLIARKSYPLKDYAIVVCMCLGLALFMHADATSSAVFSSMGVLMLLTSLTCDGAISNLSESIMKQYHVGQDEFIFRLYSIALIAITVAAAYKGDLREGLVWLTQPGTYDEIILIQQQQQSLSLNDPLPHPRIITSTWSVGAKLACLLTFSSMGFVGSSCSAAITKQFGALTMSMTSTARKAVTLFLSFFLFGNVCTGEHVVGMMIFIAALTAKSLRRRPPPHKRRSSSHIHSSSSDHKKHRRKKYRSSSSYPPSHNHHTNNHHLELVAVTGGHTYSSNNNDDDDDAVDHIHHRRYYDEEEDRNNDEESETVALMMPRFRDNVMEHSEHLIRRTGSKENGTTNNNNHNHKNTTKSTSTSITAPHPETRHEAHIV